MAKTERILDDRLEYRRHVSGRSAEDPKDLGGGVLLLERESQLGLKAGAIAGGQGELFRRAARSLSIVRHY
jgi:hypothetical protein